MSQRNFNVVDMAYRFLKRDLTMKVLQTKMLCLNEAYYRKHTTCYILHATCYMLHTASSCLTGKLQK